jgi:hypothetical protein
MHDAHSRENLKSYHCEQGLGFDVVCFRFMLLLTFLEKGNRGGCASFLPHF